MAQAIMQPYHRRSETGQFVAALRFMLFVVLPAIIVGMACAVLPPQMMGIIVVPIGIMGLLILWMLPDSDSCGEPPLQPWLIGFFCANVLWPYYIALDLPGMPWITPPRLIMLALACVAVYHISVSASLRRHVFGEGKLDLPLKLFWLYWLTTTFSLFLSPMLGFSISRYLNNQVYWTVIFHAAIYAALKPGFAQTLGKALAAVTIAISLIGILEFSQQGIFWLEHLPSFLKADPEMYARLMAGERRAGDGVYRIRGTFHISLYYAEYLALTLPLVLHQAVTSRTGWQRGLLAMGTLAVIAAAYLTGARSGVVGTLLTLLLYTLIAGYRAFRRQSRSLMAAAVVYGYPATVAVFVVLLFTWRRLHVLTLGGGQHQASTDARIAQWEMGWPKILHAPFGHGTSTSGEVLGYIGSNNTLTVDSYYLTLLLDYGFLGLALFLLMMSSGFFISVKSYLRSTNDEHDLALPFGLALVNLLIVKGALSSEINLPLAFTFLGCLIALARRQAAVAPAQTRPLPARTASPPLPARWSSLPRLRLQ